MAKVGRLIAFASRDTRADLTGSRSVDCHCCDRLSLGLSLFDLIWAFNFMINWTYKIQNPVCIKYRWVNKLIPTFCYQFQQRVMSLYAVGLIILFVVQSSPSCPGDVSVHLNIGLS